MTASLPGKTVRKGSVRSLNLVGGYRFPNPFEIEADLAGYICAIEACLLPDEPVLELPTVESPAQAVRRLHPPGRHQRMVQTGIGL
jgi:hypothetical protein